MAETSTRFSDAADGFRKLFERPDAQPYEFWIQADLTSAIKQTLERDILENGGVISKPKRFPEYGFFLIDPDNVDPLYEVKTTYHKPVDQGFIPYQRSTKPSPTPLRHVLSYRFVDAVVQKGSWDRYDLRRWGFPVQLSEEVTADAESVARRYRRQIRAEGGTDEELENSWVWATGSVFDSYEPNYDYAKEFAEMEKELKDKPVPTKEWRKWMKGLVVANYRLEKQIKFYLHDDIDEEDAKNVVKLIMKNGGATCYGHDEANVILIGSEASELEDDPQIIEWVAKKSRAGRNRFDTLIKFVPWIQACVDAGDPSNVDPDEEDVVIAYQTLKGTLPSKKSKGKESARKVNGFSTEKKRKRPSGDEEQHRDDMSSPIKRRRMDVEEGSSTLHDSTTVRPRVTSISHSRLSTVSKLGRSGAEPGSGSTVRPTRTFKGVFPPPLPHSPLIRGQKVTVSALTDSHNPQEEDPQESSEEFDPGHAIVIPSKGSPIVEQDPLKVATHYAPRLSTVSGISGFTADTAMSSKVGNTTTTATATTTTTTSTRASNAAQSARSVGPSVPSNAKQVGRPSTSTGVETSGSGASRGVLDQSIIRFGKPNSLARTTSTRASNFDEDDLAGDRLLASFDQNSSFPNDFGPPPSQLRYAAAPYVSTVQISAAEEKLLLCWREMIELDHKDGLGLIMDVINSWPQQRKELEAERDRIGTTSGKGKGKARVSFHGLDIDSKPEFNPPRSNEVETDSQDVVNSNRVEEKKLSNLGRMVNRARGSSRTPSSVEGSDGDEDDVPQQVDEEEAEEMISATRTRSKSNSIRDSRTPKTSNPVTKTPRKNRTPDVFGPVISTKKPAANSKVSPAAKPKALIEPTDEAQDPEEEEDKVAPLPPKPQRKRAQKARAGSVGSATDAEEENFKPRRGRSASAAPPDIPAQKPAKAKTGATSNRRGYAAKSTGGRPPRNR